MNEILKDPDRMNGGMAAKRPHASKSPDSGQKSASPGHDGFFTDIWLIIHTITDAENKYRFYTHLDDSEEIALMQVKIALARPIGELTRYIWKKPETCDTSSFPANRHAVRIDP
jgi:hypothetical protein